jgi:hypothetical protein
MASGKGREGLDQSNGETLTALDRALAEFASHQSLQPGEFTIQMVLDKDPSLSRATLNKRFNDMVRRGILEKRSLACESKVANAYRYVD